MKVRDIIVESTNEDWKSNLAKVATAGAMAMSPTAPPAKMMSAPAPTVAAPAAKPMVQYAQAAPIDLLSMNTESEAVLHKAARAAGIKGVELAQFMAQTSHESSDFSRMKEIGGRKYFAKKYDPKTAPKTARILGNKKVGDGERYHGRGYIQITGRDNYRMAGTALGLPLEKHPEMASKPEVAAKIAVWYWNTRVKPLITNFNDTAAVTRTINPALRGLADRQAKFANYKNVFGV